MDFADSDVKNCLIKEKNMNIKYATAEDITAVAEVEAECFPPAEAATEDSGRAERLLNRVRTLSQKHIWETLKHFSPYHGRRRATVRCTTG